MAVTKVYLIARKSIISSQISLSVRVRLYDVLEHLSNVKKISLQIVNHIDDIPDDVGDGSVLIFNKTESLESLERIRSKSKIKIIYDLDDFLPSWPSYSSFNGYCDYRFQDYIVLTDIILVPSLRFKIQLENLYDCQNKVHVFESAINYNKYLRFKTKAYNVNSDTLIYTNADSTKMTAAKSGFKDALISMLDKYPLKLKTIGDDDLDIKHKSHVHIDRLSFSKYFDELTIKDYLFAVIPLGYNESVRDDVFNDCKSPVKYWHYSLAKIPGIYSNSIVYSEVINSGFNGILCNNDNNSWFQSMEQLYLDPSLRSSIAENAFIDTLLNKNVTRYSNMFLNIIQCIK